MPLIIFGFANATDLSGPARIVGVATIWIGDTKIRMLGIDAQVTRFSEETLTQLAP